MILRHRVISSLVVRVLRSHKNRFNVEPLGFPMIHCMLHIECLNATHCFLQRAETELCEVFAHLFSNVFEEVHDKLWLTAKSLPQLWILRSNAHRTCVQVANAHHDATTHHKRSRCETKFFSTKKRSDDDVSSSFHLPIGLHNNAIAKPIEQQRLLGFGKTEFPWHASMFQRRQWRSTSSTIVSRNQHNIGLCFTYTCSNSSNTNFRHQLHMHSSSRI